jgi:hypothetical protein
MKKIKVGFIVVIAFTILVILIVLLTVGGLKLVEYNVWLFLAISYVIVILGGIIAIIKLAKPRQKHEGII